jgi:hypothetical protein
VSDAVGTVVLVVRSMYCSPTDSMLLLTKNTSQKAGGQQKSWSSEACVHGVNHPSIRKVEADEMSSFVHKKANQQ